MGSGGITTPTPRDIACSALVTLLVILTLSCAPPPSSDSYPRTSGAPSYVTARSLGQLVEEASIIAVGRLEAVEEEINRARDAGNPARASDRSYVLGQVYRVRVERYVKGDGPDTIRVVQSEAWDDGGSSRMASSSREEIQRRRQEALDRGYWVPFAPEVTYVIFLQPLGVTREDDYLVGPREPWRFVLSDDGHATPDSPWDGAERSFPPRPTEELFEEIERLTRERS